MRSSRNPTPSQQAAPGAGDRRREARQAERPTGAIRVRAKAGGRAVATLEALATCGHAGCLLLLVRHAEGDWGDLDGQDWRSNEQALKTGAWLLSAYDTAAGRVWIITEADRSSTCILLPSEY